MNDPDPLSTLMMYSSRAVRVQVRINGAALLTYIIGLLALWFTGGDTCVNYVVSWLGMLPLVVAMTGAVLIGLYVTTPRLPSHVNDMASCIWLMQRFAWTEKSLPRKVSERAAELRMLCDGRRAVVGPDTEPLPCCSEGILHSPSDDATGRKSRASPPPMFCFETCIKLFFWAALIYDYTEAEGHTFQALPEPIRELLGEVEAAMRLFGLMRRRLFYDRRRGTKVLVAWSDDTIVVTVRGSIERANFYEDAKARYLLPPLSAL
jgi:hypothetical protein